MNKFILFAFLSICNLNAFSQAPYPYQEITLSKASDYKEMEPVALRAANFLLTTPYKQNDRERTHAQQFLFNWMIGAKDYQFRLTGLAAELLEDKDVFSIYNAAMAKFCIENKTLCSNSRLMEITAGKLVLSYADNPANNIKLRKKVRKKLENL